MVGKSTHLQVISQQSTQNTANLPLQSYEKNQWTFFVVQHGRQLNVQLSVRNNFANSGSFAQVSVPVHIYNSLKIPRNWSS